MARLFLYSAGALLLLTGVAKLISGSGHSRILLEHDPVTGLRFRDLFLAAGTMEIIIAVVCLLSKRVWFSVGLLAWLSTNFVVYRIGLSQTGYFKPCSCLGNLTDALHIPSHTVDITMKIILCYLLVGSYATFFWFWKINHKPRVDKSYSDDKSKYEK